jgi:HK97 gp10 family phage protein
MPVKGARAVSLAFETAPMAVRSRVKKAMEYAANKILADMKMLVGRDSGALAAALTKLEMEDGKKYFIGLPTPELARQYFYARFLEQGTKGGLVVARRRTKDGRGKPYTLRVPPKARRPFMEPALNMNADDIDRLIKKAIQDGLREAQR